MNSFLFSLLCFQTRGKVGDVLKADAWIVIVDVDVDVVGEGLGWWRLRLSLP